MATNLKILGWSSEGLRCPDHKLSFEKEVNKVYRISLIQMPNGTGKTTTLKLLRAALAGPSIWDNTFDEPIQFRKHNEIKKGTFELKLLHDDRILTIKMLFNFNSNDIPLYKTTKTHGTDNGFSLPDKLTPFLSPDFVKLLIFDGELANQLLDPRNTNAQQAIENLYRLPLFYQIKERVEDYWTNIANNAGSSGGQRSFPDVKIV